MIAFFDNSHAWQKNPQKTAKYKVLDKVKRENRKIPLFFWSREDPEYLQYDVSTAQGSSRSPKQLDFLGHFEKIHLTIHQNLIVQWPPWLLDGHSNFHILSQVEQPYKMIATALKYL